MVDSSEMPLGVMVAVVADGLITVQLGRAMSKAKIDCGPDAWGDCWPNRQKSSTIDVIQKDAATTPMPKLTLRSIPSGDRITPSVLSFG